MRKGKLDLPQGNSGNGRAESPEFGRFSTRFLCMRTWGFIHLVYKKSPGFLDFLRVNFHNYSLFFHFRGPLQERKTGF